MTVLIMHPNDEIFYADLQKELIETLFAQDRIIYSQHPLWIELGDFDIKDKALIQRNSGCTPRCCGQEMVLQVPNTVDAAKEKHVPIVEKSASGGVLVKVGSVAHPMTEAHYITWVQIETPDRMGRHYFQPGDAPEFEFKCAYEAGIVVKAYCNLHGLWQTTI